jgi:hypothetical protein
MRAEIVAEQVAVDFQGERGGVTAWPIQRWRRSGLAPASMSIAAPSGSARD